MPGAAITVNAGNTGEIKRYLIGHIVVIILIYMTSRVHISVGNLKSNRIWGDKCIVAIYDHLPRLIECCEGRYVRNECAKTGD